MAAPQTKEELMQKALDDPRYIIERGFMVVNKERNPVPFIFKNLQNEFYDQRTTRDDILKGSQLGFSTMILGILTVKFLLVPNCWCVCISHEAEATKRLFDKVDYFLNHLPPWLSCFYRPDTDSDKNLVNGVMGSKFYIGTAGAKAFGRGDTIHYAHMSEVSRWKDSTIATGIIRAVPLNDKNTWIVKETTANGEGNWHHQEWKREKEGMSEFRPYFGLWLKDETCRIEDAQIIEEDYTEEEKMMVRRFPKLATSETLAFRRKQIRTLQSESGYTPEEMFKQEFPIDDSEAFLYSGNPFFPVPQLEEYKTTCKKPICVGNLVGLAPNETFDETERGYLKLYEMPEIGGQYIIGADTGQKHDRCTATVVDKKTWKTVAKFKAVMGASQFGYELNKLGRFYNNGELAIEVNNMGQATIDKLVELEYPHLYMREDLQVVNGVKKTKKIPGWLTNSISRPKMLGYLQDIVRTIGAEIPDEDIIDEMKTFVRHPDGSYSASEGNYDDCVISTAIAYYVLSLHPFVELAKHATKTIIKRVAKFKKFRTAAGKKTFRRFRNR